MPPSCDILLTNAHVLTMDGRFTAWPSGSVGIRGNAIVDVGPIAGTTPRSRRSTAAAAS